jgi:hypothetical protein
MTTARQFGKEKPAPIAVFALALCLIAGTPLAAPAGGITERIVVDRFTGLAIGGYDPVAFYTDGKPMPGSPDFELSYGGVAATGRRSPSGPMSICRASAATIRSASPTGWPQLDGPTSG